jgi:hypothetical protein
MLNKVVVAASALLFTSLVGKVSAHDEPMDANWCSGGQITILGHFQLNQSLLKKFKGDENAVCNNLKSCGQFDDDDYSIANRTALSICSSFSATELTMKTDGDNNTVRPIFYSPINFKSSEANHHLLYGISQGVEFSCGQCSLDVMEAADAEETSAKTISN